MRDAAFEAIRPRLEEAVRLHQMGERSRAITVYRELLTEQPNLPPLANLLGLALVQEGQVEEGLNQLSRAVELAPNFADAWLNLAFARYEADDREGALAAYRRVLELQPKNLTALLSYASLLGEEYATPAIAALRRATELAPRQALPWLRLRRLYQVQGDRAGVAETERRIAELELRTPEELVEAGNMELSKGSLSEALAHFRAAQSMHPGMAAAALGLGEALALSGNRAEAAQHLQRAARLAPRRSKPWLVLGNTYLTAGQREAAAEAFRQALARDEGPIAQHLLNVAAGLPAVNTPVEYLRWVYGVRAPTYDATLERLGNSLPGRIADLVQQVMPGGARSALDLGCGTGLLGTPLRPLARRLAGLDVSTDMMNAAAFTRRYDDLIGQEAVAYFQSTQERYDLIVAADMLIHIGELQPLFSQVAAHLDPGGCFIATIECGDAARGAGYVLQLSGTFVHSDDYLRATAEAAGLETVHWAEVPLPREEGKPAPGTLAAFRKPAATS